MNIPADPSLGYIAVVLFLIGFFLFITGLGIVRIEKITVHTGIKTWILGLFLMLGSAVIGLSRVPVEERVPGYPEQTPAPEDADEPRSLPAAPEAKQQADRTVPRVKYTDLTLDDVLYTRGCSSAAGVFWINRFLVKRIDAKGIAWGSYERATIYDPAFSSLSYRDQGEPLNLSETCVSGGCYTQESAAVADVRGWIARGCPW